VIILNIYHSVAMATLFILYPYYTLLVQTKSNNKIHIL
jgi:hypothetical protein